MLVFSVFSDIILVESSEDIFSSLLHRADLISEDTLLLREHLKCSMHLLQTSLHSFSFPIGFSSVLEVIADLLGTELGRVGRPLEFVPNVELFYLLGVPFGFGEAFGTDGLLGVHAELFSDLSHL